MNDNEEGVITVHRRGAAVVLELPDKDIYEMDIETAKRFVCAIIECCA